jgi:hypothetical protein
VSEEWRPVVGYESTYQVSSLGRVSSRPRVGTPGGLLKHFKAGEYPAVKLVQDGVQRTHHVHKLIADAFLGPRPFGHVIRHLDGDHFNCRLSNLKYGTESQNQQDSVLHGTHKNIKKTHCPKGHDYAVHAYRIPSRPGARYCRRCQSDRGRARNAARKAAREAAPTLRQAVKPYS